MYIKRLSAKNLLTRYGCCATVRLGRLLPLVPAHTAPPLKTILTETKLMPDMPREATDAPPPGHQMTSAADHPYSAYIASGWTDALLIDHGLMTAQPRSLPAPPPPTPAPAPEPKPVPQMPPGAEMTDHAEHPYEWYIANGWTDIMLVQQGLLFPGPGSELVDYHPATVANRRLQLQFSAQQAATQAERIEFEFPGGKTLDDLLAPFIEAPESPSTADQRAPATTPPPNSRAYQSASQRRAAKLRDDWTRTDELRDTYPDLDAALELSAMRAAGIKEAPLPVMLYEAFKKWYNKQTKKDPGLRSSPILRKAYSRLSARATPAQQIADKNPHLRSYYARIQWLRDVDPAVMNPRLAKEAIAKLDEQGPPSHVRHAPKKMAALVGKPMTERAQMEAIAAEPMPDLTRYLPTERRPAMLAAKRADREKIARIERARAWLRAQDAAMAATAPPVPVSVDPVAQLAAERAARRKRAYERAAMDWPLRALADIKYLVEHGLPVPTPRYPQPSTAGVPLWARKVPRSWHVIWMVDETTQDDRTYAHAGHPGRASHGASGRAGASGGRAVETGLLLPAIFDPGC